MERTGQATLMGEIRNACNILIKEPHGRRRHGRPRRGQENNIKTDLRKKWLKA
jgi:hypothetical protein